MYEMAKKAREAMKSKAQRIAGPVKGAIDASGWSEPTMNMGSQTGLKPVSRRQFRAGGAVSGPATTGSAVRAARKSGGKAGGGPVESYATDDTKEDNADAFGSDTVGAMKRGGRAKKAFGGPMGKMAPPAGGLIDPRAAAAARMGQGSARANVPTAALRTDGGLRKGLMSPLRAVKKGGAIHADKAQDMALIKKSVRTGCRTGKADGGEVTPGNSASETTPKLSRPRLPSEPAIRETLKGLSQPRERPSLGDLMKDERKKGGKVKGDAEGARPVGARVARKAGGRAKGKTNINIIIGQPGGGAPQGGPPDTNPVLPPPVMTPPPPPGAGPPMPMPAPAAAPPMPMPPPQMPAGPSGRKRGGRAYPIDTGGGGGLARLDKIRAYGSPPPKSLSR